MIKGWTGRARGAETINTTVEEKKRGRGHYCGKRFLSFLDLEPKELDSGLIGFRGGGRGENKSS